MSREVGSEASASPTASPKGAEPANGWPPGWRTRRTRPDKYTEMQPIHIIGVPLDLGGNRRGVDMGPSALRIAGLGDRIGKLGYTVNDKGDLPSPIPETQELRDERKKYIQDIARVCG